MHPIWTEGGLVLYLVYPDAATSLPPPSFWNYEALFLASSKTKALDLKLWQICVPFLLTKFSVLQLWKIPNWIL